MHSSATRLATAPAWMPAGLPIVPPPTPPAAAGGDAEKCADLVRPFLALYAGGMGAKGANFHYEVFARMGYGDEVEEIQDLFLAGRKDEAIEKFGLAIEKAPDGEWAEKSRSRLEVLL